MASARCSSTNCEGNRIRLPPPPSNGRQHETIDHVSSNGGLEMSEPTGRGATGRGRADLMALVIGDHGGSPV